MTIDSDSDVAPEVSDNKIEKKKTKKQAKATPIDQEILDGDVMMDLANPLALAQDLADSDSDEGGNDFLRRDDGTKQTPWSFKMAEADKPKPPTLGDEETLDATDAEN